MKIKSIVIVFAFLSLFFSAHAQDKTMDSLKTVFQNQRLNDTTKMGIISNVMDNNYTENDPQYFYLNNWLGKLVSESLKKKNNAVVHRKIMMWQGTYYSVLGIESFVKGQAPKSVAYLDKSIAIYKSLKAYDDMHYEMVTKATFLSQTNRYKESISCLFTALAYFEKDKTKYVGELSYAYSILANVYADQKLNEKAIVYYKKSVDYYERDTSTPQNSKDHVVSVIYMNIATAYAQLRKNSESMVYAYKSAALSKKIGDSVSANFALCRIGDLQMEEGQYDKAEKTLLEVLPNATDARTIAFASTAIGKLYYKKKDYKKADFYAEKGFSVGKENNFLDIQEQASALLFNVNQDAKNFEKALKMHAFHDKLIDSTKIESSKNALLQQQLKYDYEKKELNYKLSAQKKEAAKDNWLIGLLGLLVILLLGVYFYYRNNKQKQAITILEKDQIKQKLLVTQMNPHFIFNSIDNIQGLIHDKKDKEAVNYLTKFSVLTRQILENSNENYISLTEEVQMIENYLAIQQLLYNNKFDFSISVDEAIDGETIYLPPMLTQPFIENSIKHGLSNKDQNGQVAIHFYLKESKLFFEVTDNGKGFDAVQKPTSHKSLAMTITKERLIGYTKNQDFVVQTDNIKDTNENVVGAKVSFEIPYIYEN